MTLVARADAIKAALSLPPEMPPGAAIGTACEMMGFVPERGTPLPAIADALMEQIGCTVETATVPTSPTTPGTAAAPAAAASFASSATSAAGYTAAPAAAAHAKVGGKQKAASSADSFEKPPPASEQRKIFEGKDIRKLFIPKKALAQIASRQSDGEAVTYEEVQESAALEVIELPSEKALVATPGPVYGCDRCDKTFSNAGALASHKVWAHPSAPRGQSVNWRRPPFPGELSANLCISADHVRMTLLINGKSREQLAQEAQEAAAEVAAANAERNAEQLRRAYRRQKQRESEEAIDHVEQRRGSDHRHQYTYHEKAQLLDLLDKINANAQIANKGEAFEKDPRRRGCPYKTVHKWTKPAERRKIAVGAAQEHAKSLLRFDKTSRRKGKYTGMETRLFEYFRKRRSRARKTTSRWLVHTAKHIMRCEYPEHAAVFKASKGWLQRFKRRKGIVTRKKTNVKNTTWEETEPVLQKYFVAFRRRLRDTEWRRAREARVAAARAATEPPTQGIAGDAARAAERAAWLTCDAEEEAATNEAIAAAFAARVIATSLTDDALQRRSPRECARNEESAEAAAEPDRPWWDHGHAKWGKYLPFQRSNVDQVPLPFIVDMDYTLEEKGAKRVAINQLGPSLSKRQCTAQVAFRPEPPPPPADASDEVKRKYKKHLMAQPPPCLIFRGTGQNISQREKDAYPPELVVLWQKKAWVDRPIAIEWQKKGWKPMIDADIAAGVADASSRYLQIADNLDAQDASRNPEYIAEMDRNLTDDHKVPAGKTDQVQPVDRGKGRQIKIYVGQEEDEWLEDDDNLQKYENNELTASDRRILLANWYCKAYHRSNEGTSNQKYFEHAGGLLTADGTGDDLIKLEGVPQGKQFSWTDDPLDAPPTAAAAASPLEVVPDPEDAGPMREDTIPEAEDADNVIDEEDDEDEEDAPPSPCEAPAGFSIVDEPPPAAALVPKDPAQETLVGRSVLFCWQVVGWCVGVITEANTDRRYKVDGEVVNFCIHYEIDDNKSKHVLTLPTYGGDEAGSWVLLEALA